jgi:hypothetical protein
MLISYASGLSNLKLFITPINSFVLVVGLSSFSATINSNLTEGGLTYTWPFLIANLLFGISAGVVMLILQINSEKRSKKGHLEVNNGCLLKNIKRLQKNAKLCH